MHRSTRSHQYYDKYNKKGSRNGRGLITFLALVFLLFIAAVYHRGNRRAGDEWMDLMKEVGGEDEKITGSITGSPLYSTGFKPPPFKRQGNFKASDRDRDLQQHLTDGTRIAIIIPYLGESLPPYFPLFAWSAAGSAGLVDFFVFHAGSVDRTSEMNSPDNVKFIDLKSAEGFADLHVKVAEPPEGEGKGDGESYDKKLKKILTEQFTKHPYTLVEFKPAYGHIFSEYTSEYSHWGYGDLDMTFGDLASWVTEEELNDWDIVTYSHGDQGSVYLRGQFTFHKNVDAVNNVWRHCDYLSDLPGRYNLRKGEKKAKYRFESAEGCYSYAALQEENIKVKYVVKAMTDFGDDDPIHQSGLKLIERAGTVVVAKPGKGTDKEYFRGLTSENVYGKGKTKGGGDDNDPISTANTLAEGDEDFYTDVESMAKIQSYRQAGKSLGGGRGCMFWAPKTYQLDICAVNVKETDTVKWIDGVLYKQKYNLVKFPGGVETAPFFHFQEWKRKYRHGQFNVMGGEGSYLVRKEGIARIPSVEDEGDLADWKSWQERKEIRQDCESFPLPAVTYCSEFANTKGDNDGKKNVHCSKTIGWFGSEVRVAKCPKQDPIGFGGVDSVTLTLTVDLGGGGLGGRGVVEERWVLNLVAQSLDAWHDRPAVVIVHVDGNGGGVNLGKLMMGRRKNLLCVVVSGAEYNRNSLLNMATDAARTRYVLNGLNVERGQVLAKDSLLFVERAIEGVGVGEAGGVWVLPHVRLVGKKWDRSGNLKQFGTAELVELGNGYADQVEFWSADQHDECWKKCFKGAFRVSPGGGGGRWRKRGGI
ncbi:hypothetical protein TL16_g03733 [Triparma laevis f. inornata]|uniref:Uncharacterized protein n=1 Tax=Triparma laevis f. inornata TaxID=1714386 RepID=A0A9W7A912_9STRA|nr:hypothetical protein TL16_g03733 [Triparma laevis f. inornata]